jgi:hypothetical protein
MGKWIAILLGVVLLALGVWGIWAWWYDIVWPFIAGGLVVMAIIVGLGAIAFGVSEVRSAAEERKLAEPVAPTAPPTAPPAAPGGGEPPSEGGQTPPPTGG